jgi:hypothetical protein
MTDPWVPEPTDTPSPPETAHAGPSSPAATKRPGASSPGAGTRLAPAPAVAAGYRPGHCSAHPDHRLVVPSQAGHKWDPRKVAVLCTHPDHGPYDADRCRWCGGPLADPALAWVPYAQGNRRQYCADLCRVYAMRARRRMAGERER